MNLNFNEICRLCLRICEEYVDLNKTNEVKTLADDLVEKIKYCYFVQVDLSEGFPTKVCYECIQVLSFFYAAKKNVINCDKLLREILYLRQKLEKETKSHKDENVLSPDIIEIKQIVRKTKPFDPEVSVIDSKQSDLCTENVIKFESNCGSGYINYTENIATPFINTEKNIANCDTTKSLLMSKHDSKVKRRKKLEQLKHSVATLELLQNKYTAKFLMPSNSNLKDLKKESSQRGKTSQSIKDELQLEVDPPLKENIVKEIGTVIDTNNILSPHVKRTRKSISAR